MTIRILLAVDTGDASDSATRWVAARANRADVAVEVVSVATDFGPLRDAAKAAVARATATLADLAPGLEVSGAVRDGAVVDTLVSLSGETDMMVIGSDRAHPIVAALHGTLPMRLSGRAECDLVVVPRSWSGNADGPILVGWESEPGAYTVVDAAAEVARATGAAVRLVHFWTPPTTTPYDGAAVGYLLADLEREEARMLDEATSAARNHYPELDISAELHLGSVMAGLLARAREASMVVVGSTRRTTIGEIVLGSTGDALIGHAEHTPVLIAGRSREGATARQ